MSEELTQNLPNDNLSRVLTRLDSIDNHLVTLDGKVDSIDTRLTTLEEKVDRRLMEARPIWEQVLARLDGLEEKLDSGLRRFERQVRLLLDDVMDVRGDNRDLEKRMDKLELKQQQ